MHIERRLRDPKGTRVRLGDTTYHFKAIWEEGPHVASVTDKVHQDVLLAIREGYREYTGPLPEAANTAAPIAPPVTAPEADAPVQDVEPAKDADKGDQKDSAPANGEDAPTGDEAELTALPNEKLREVFREEVGRVAPPKSKPETMIAQILAKREETADAQNKEA